MYCLNMHITNTHVTSLWAQISFPTWKSQIVHKYFLFKKFLQQMCYNLWTDQESTMYIIIFYNPFSLILTLLTSILEWPTFRAPPCLSLVASALGLSKPRTLLRRFHHQSPEHHRHPPQFYPLQLPCEHHLW